MRIRDDGFTLVEVLVSLVLVSVATAIVASQLASGRAAARASQQAIELLYVARSKIAEIGIARPLQAGSWTGREVAGIAWEISIEPYFEDTRPDQSAAYRIVVTTWPEAGGRGAEVSLQTIRTTLVHGH